MLDQWGDDATESIKCRKAVAKPGAVRITRAMTDHESNYGSMRVRKCEASDSVDAQLDSGNPKVEEDRSRRSKHTVNELL